jgi:hypothetical protein
MFRKKMMKGNRLSIVTAQFGLSRGMLFGILIVGALIAFEMFNYSTTEFALLDLLGELSFAGIRWATILTIAFCGIDFAGIARLFTPERGEGNPIEVWYLLAAWLLAAFMNAILTWWGVSIALLSHETFENVVIGRETVLRVVPIFVAVLVWLIRVLIIGTISLAGDSMFMIQAGNGPLRMIPEKRQSGEIRSTDGQQSGNRRPVRRPVPAFRPRDHASSQPELTYHPVEPYYAESSETSKTRRF